MYILPPHLLKCHSRNYDHIPSHLYKLHELVSPPKIQEMVTLVTVDIYNQHPHEEEVT